MKNKLKELGERAEKIKTQLKTEEATKHSLVLPFIQALGYDIYNPSEVVPEYVADFALKKGEKVDYAILDDGKPVILIECKHWEETLPKHSGQLFRYYSTIPGKKLAILTNGFSYMFFSDLEETNKLDHEPFFTFEITHLKDDHLSEIGKLQKTGLDIGSFLDAAEELKFLAEIKRTIIDELNEPSEKFIKFISQSLFGTIKRISFLTPLIKQAAQQAKEEIIAERFRIAQEVSAKKDEDAKTAALEPEKPKTEVVTTQEEIDFYNIIKAIACEIVSASRISYKDFMTLFGIMLDGKQTQIFCRFVSNTKRKTMSLLYKDKTEEDFNLASMEDVYQYRENILNAIKSYEPHKE
jgi:hypothetical protein